MSLNTSIVGKRSATFDEIFQQTQIIIKKFDPLKIVLFGSYAWGETSPESDVDLLVVIDSKRSVRDLLFEMTMALDHIFPIDLIVKTEEEIQSRLSNGDFFIRDILEKGKVLYERTD